LRQALCAGLLAGSTATRVAAQPEPLSDAPPQAALSAFHVQEARVGDLDACVVLFQQPTLPRGTTARVLVRLRHAGTAPQRGSLHVLSTAMWEVRPSRHLPFELTAPGDTTSTVFELALPEHASPGPYDFVLRVEVAGVDIGTLRTRFFRPLEWISIGPFAPPAGALLLPPENGINFEQALAGIEGELRWRRVPVAAYDATGAVELDLVHGPAPTPRCACVLTMIDLAEGERLHWNAVGANRLMVDGRLLIPSDPIRLGPGRHTLLARSCATDQGWRLGLSLLRKDGSWPGQLDNDLMRFLPGFDHAMQSVSDPGSHRNVVLEVRQPGAREVAVLGSFNAWIPWRLTRGPQGVWSRALVLPPGRYAYKLRVDGQIQTDPRALRQEADGFGGSNSLLIVP